ncbi:MAG: Hpt domain-containing protein, partial [Rubrivivax sp.]|nr:Hpt domain-containing protein [Rubrivivax sp.]
MREVFIEEAREVLADANAALEHLAETPESTTELTSVRRAFHTLKGSSRMVGLSAFGEAAWGCEQLYNARLAQAPRMDAPLREFTDEALQYLADWVEAIAAGRDDGHRAEDVVRAADTLRQEGRRVAIGVPGPKQPPTIALPRAALPDAGATGEVPTIVLPRPAAEPSAPVSAPVPLQASGPSTIALPGRGTPPPSPTDLPRTVALPGRERREVAPDSGFGFTLDLGAPAPPGPPAVVQRLQEQVPQLPSAADLDLGAQAPQPLAGSLDFPLPTLDLADATEVPPAPGETTGRPAGLAGPTLAEAPLDFDLPLPETAEAPLAAEEVPRTEPTPVPEVASFDLDLAGLDEPAAAAGGTAPDIDLGPTTHPGALDLPAGDAQSLDIDAEELERVFATQPQPPVAPEAAPEEPVKVIGTLRISIPLFNIFLNEADELSRRLVTELGEWGVEPSRHPVPETAVALAHSLAGTSATVGYADLSALARALEHALARSAAAGRGRRGEPALFSDAADEIRRLLHQFAAGFLPPASPQLMERLAEHEHLPELSPTGAVPGVAVEISDFLPLMAEPEAGVAPRSEAFDDDEDLDATDAVDPELFPVFDEEAAELLPQLQNRLLEWHDHPGDRDAPAACMRTLHTLKGGARLAGAMRLGELAHRLETAIERLAARGPVHAADIEPLLLRSDRMATLLEALRSGGGEPAAAPPPAAVPSPMPATRPTAVPP